MSSETLNVIKIALELAVKGNATPEELRSLGRILLGDLLPENEKHPLIVFFPGGVAMRFVTSVDTLWIKVPDEWIQG